MTGPRSTVCCFQLRSQIAFIPDRKRRNHSQNKQRAENQLSIDDADAALINKLESDPYFNGDETQRLFQKAILQLPEKQRIIFNLKYFQEMKYEDMSEILGTSVGALKASYHHAVKKIEDFFHQHD